MKTVWSVLMLCSAALATLVLAVGSVPIALLFTGAAFFCGYKLNRVGERS